MSSHPLLQTTAGPSLTAPSNGPTPRTNPKSAPGSTNQKQYAHILRLTTASHNPSPGDNNNTMRQEPYSIARSYSQNALIADFTGSGISLGEAIEAITNTTWQTSQIAAKKSGQALEVGFLSHTALQRALTEGLKLRGRSIPLTRCFLHNRFILPVTISNLPCFSISDTNKELVSRLHIYGDIIDIRYHYWGDTGIRKDSCVVLIDQSSKTHRQAIPRTIHFFGAPCPTWWRGAEETCRYCRRPGHLIKDCPTLPKKPSRTEDPVPAPSKPSFIMAIIPANTMATPAISIPPEDLPLPDLPPLNTQDIPRATTPAPALPLQEPPPLSSTPTPLLRGTKRTGSPTLLHPTPTFLSKNQFDELLRMNMEADERDLNSDDIMEEEDDFEDSEGSENEDEPLGDISMDQSLPLPQTATIMDEDAPFLSEDDNDPLQVLPVDLEQPSSRDPLTDNSQ